MKHQINNYYLNTSNLNNYLFLKRILNVKTPC